MGRTTTRTKPASSHFVERKHTAPGQERYTRTKQLDSNWTGVETCQSTLTDWCWSESAVRVHERTYWWRMITRWASAASAFPSCQHQPPAVWSIALGRAGVESGVEPGWHSPVKISDCEIRINCEVRPVLWECRLELYHLSYLHCHKTEIRSSDVFVSNVSTIRKVNRD